MIRLKWCFIYLIVIILVDFSMASTDGGIDKKVTDLFEINWESLRYNKTVTQYNPEVSSNQQASRAYENLTLSCKIEIKDPNLVLGTLREGLITEITDSKRRDIEISQEIPRSGYMPYDGLRYERRFTQPPKMPRWRVLIYKYLRIKPKPFRPELINELQPARVHFQLDLGLLEPAGGEIRHLKGYFYALTVESIEYVDVPFEPNDNWVGLTDEVAIQVRQADCTIAGSSVRYNFNIEENWTGAERARSLSVGDFLPEKMVREKQLIMEDGKQLDRSPGFRFLPPRVGGRRSGSSSRSGGIGPIKKIRFVIAVNPKHCKIPFELKNIPLPNPELKEEEE